MKVYAYAAVPFVAVLFLIGTFSGCGLAKSEPIPAHQMAQCSMTPTQVDKGTGDIAIPKVTEWYCHQCKLYYQTPYGEHPKSPGVTKSEESADIAGSVPTEHKSIIEKIRENRANR